MTRPGRSRLVWFLVMFLAGSAIGFLVGAYTGTQFGMGLIGNNVLRRDAQEVEARIEALRLLRDQDSAGAIEILEAEVDDSLIIFDPREPIPGIDAETEARIARSIAGVYRYRQSYPRRSGRPFIDEMLRNLYIRHGLE